jgi:2-methylcitrate dehydratase PrpD
MLALLATEQGLTGPKRAFEDPRGFCLTLCAEPRWQFLQSFDSFFLPQVAFKPYPCARQLHAGVEALLKLIQRHAMTPASIQEIELFVPTQNASMVNRPAISTLRAATLGSGQYVMAVTALRGKIDLASFEEEFLCNEEVSRLIAKVKVSGSAELDRHFPKYWSGRVTIRSMDGQTHSEEIIAPKGESENPLSRADVEEKFLDLAAPVLGDAGARAAIGAVHALASSESVAPLLAAIAVPA